MNTMKDTTELDRVIDAINSLDYMDKCLYLHALFGLVKLDSPQSILDAAKWTSVAEEIEKALDNLA